MKHDEANMIAKIDRLHLSKLQDGTTDENRARPEKYEVVPDYNRPNDAKVSSSFQMKIMDQPFDSFKFFVNDHGFCAIMIKR